MRSAGKIIVLVSLVFLSACVGPQKTSFPPYMPAKTGVSIEKDISLYSRAVKKLGVKLANELNRLGERYASEKKSFFIYNADAHEGKERELARRLIEDLSALLVNKKIKIKRKELVTWDRAIKSGESFKIECQEVLENLASDFFIEFSLKECPESANCMEAGVRVIACESNDIVFTAKESFNLTGNVANWYHQKHKLPRVKGSRENPYLDYREAANYMVGRLSCIAQNIMPDDTMHILVAKTKNTHSEVATAFSETVSFYGLEQIIVPEWLPVAIRAGDQFELGIYRKEHRELFETANLVLALDMKNAENGKLFLKAHLLAIRSINIIKDGKNKTLGAGMALPYCACSGYASSYSSDNHTSLSDTTPVKSIEKQVFQPSYRKIQSTRRTGNASASYQRAQSAMLRDLENNLRDRLKKDGISPAVVNLIFITGSLDLPDCRKKKIITFHPRACLLVTTVR